MDTTLQLYAKQNFLSELLFIDAKEVKQILNKIKLLLIDPTPDIKPPPPTEINILSI